MKSSISVQYGVLNHKIISSSGSCIFLRKHAVVKSSRVRVCSMLQKEFIKQCNYAEITLGRLNPLIPISLYSLCCGRMSGLQFQVRFLSLCAVAGKGW